MGTYRKQFAALMIAGLVGFVSLQPAQAWDEEAPPPTPMPTATATLTSTPTPSATVTPTPTPSFGANLPSGLTFVVWNGGSVIQAVADARAASVTAWDGFFFFTYIPMAPAFVNERFFEAYPGGVVPAGRVVIVLVP